MEDLRLNLAYGYFYPTPNPAPDLQKASSGEGSRGGRVIGHTRSGKPIYDSAGHSEHRKYTADERQDVEDRHRQSSTKVDKRVGGDEASPKVSQQRKTYMPLDGGREGRYDPPGLKTYKKILRLFKQQDIEFQGHITYKPKEDAIYMISDRAPDLIREAIAKFKASKPGA